MPNQIGSGAMVAVLGMLQLCLGYAASRIGASAAGGDGSYQRMQAGEGGTAKGSAGQAAGAV